MTQPEDDTAPWEHDRSYTKLTLKAGKGYEDTWVNLGASNAGEFRRLVGGFFGWTEEQTAGLTLAQLSFNATREWHAMNNVAAEFPDSRSVPAELTAQPRKSARKAAKPAEIVSDVPTEEALIAEIGSAEDVKTLQAIYTRENKAGRKLTGAVLAAWNARGKALKSA